MEDTDKEIREADWVLLRRGEARGSFGRDVSASVSTALECWVGSGLSEVFLCTGGAVEERST